MVEAAEALSLGLVMEVVPENDLEGRVTELARSFFEGAPIAQLFAKQGLNHGLHTSLSEALGWEAQAQAICLHTDDVVEGVSAFVEKRPPRFQGR